MQRASSVAVTPVVWDHVARVRISAGPNLLWGVRISIRGKWLHPFTRDIIFILIKVRIMNWELHEQIERSTKFPDAVATGDRRTILQAYDADLHTWEWAARRGHFGVIKWLHANRKKGCWPRVMNLAAKHGRLDMVKWLHENRTEGCTARAMDMAAASGHLEVVKWLHENRTEGCTPAAMDYAAGEGLIDVVKWLHEHQKTCTTNAMDWAAEEGHLELVKWLYKNRTEGCTSWAMTNAAENGHLEVVEWLRENPDAKKRESRSREQTPTFPHASLN